MNLNHREKILIGNWKMNLTVKEAKLLAARLVKKSKHLTADRFIGIAPSFTALESVGKKLKGSSIALGAQNCSYKSKGAFTGEESVETLKELGVKFVIIGHSERRSPLRETDEIIHKKVKKALESGLRVILCVGERIEQRETGTYKGFVTGQVMAAISGISDVSKLSIAYEPVWAISTSGFGKKPTPDLVQEMHHEIRDTLQDECGIQIGRSVSILYGGSVDANNVREYLQKDDIDGALVGGASLNAESLVRIFGV